LASLPLNTLISVPLLFFRAILFCLPPTLRAKIRGSELAYYINPASFSRFDPRQIFLRLEMLWVKFFWRPYLYKKIVFTERAWLRVAFLPCFDGVISRDRNVLPSTFPPWKIPRRELNFNCGGTLSRAEQSRVK
jgi:hypothetical protein